LIVIGWDPGTSNLGFGVLDLGTSHARCLAHGNVGQSSARGVPEQLDALAAKIDELMNRWTPEVMGYEDQAGVEVAMQRDGTGLNYSSRRLHEVTGMLRYAARCSLTEPIPLYVPQPRSVKVAVLGRGHGGADKKSIQKWINRMFGVDANSHAADAIGVAVAAVRYHRVALAGRRRSSTLVK
jgi:Holliday junction resolvasome RuvABC endonuclease subunit